MWFICMLEFGFGLGLIVSVRVFADVQGFLDFDFVWGGGFWSVYVFCIELGLG